MTQEEENRMSFDEWMRHIRSVHYANKPAMDRAWEKLLEEYTR
jgi:hypothetical protein